MNTNQTKLLGMLENGKVLVMLAPSFAIDFDYPAVIGMLHELGFDKVTELTFGARMVNYWYAEYIKAHPDQKYYITSPCPTCDLLIKNQYPELLQFLMPYSSPMAAMAKIAKKNFSDHKIAFASPCWAKQMIEAPRYTDVLDIVITFKDLKEIFELKGINASKYSNDSELSFDSFHEEDTKIYPISGGLAETAKVREYFEEEEILVADGIANLLKIFEEIKNGTTKYRFFDILNCPGGCIGGPAITNKDLPVEEKKKRVLDYKAKAERTAKPNPGQVESEADLDFNVNFKI